MATKTGILSDKNYMKNCEEYKALPIGYANYNFVGNRPNPNLLGVKTPRYQRSAPRPASADVLAVNMARMQGGGNTFASAREMLDMYIKEGKEFKPPPVKLKSLEENLEELHAFIYSDKFEADELVKEWNVANAPPSLSKFVEDYYGLAAGPVPKVILQNRGDAILKQTISQGVNTADIPDRHFYLARFNQVSRPQKEQIYNKMTNALRQEGVNTSSYLLGTQPRISDLEANMSRLMEIVYARSVVVDLDNIFGMLRPQLESVGLQTTAGSRESSSSQSVAGTSTELSVAPTQQGVSMPSTSTTTQEVEKK